MNKHLANKLTPFDLELCNMVESLTGKPCEPLQSQYTNQYFIVVDYSDNTEPLFVSAVMDAIAGRVGDRLEEMKDDPESCKVFAYIRFREFVPEDKFAIGIARQAASTFGPKVKFDD